MKYNNKYFGKIFCLMLFVIFIHSIFSNEFKVNRIFKVEFKNNLFVLDCVDTKNKKFKIVSFYNEINENDSFRIMENLILNLNIDTLPKEFVYEEIFPSFIPINNMKDNMSNVRFQHNLGYRIDNIECFNTKDTFYYTNCLDGLKYIPKCNDSTSLENILKLGYKIDKNGLIIKNNDTLNSK